MLSLMGLSNGAKFLSSYTISILYGNLAIFALNSGVNFVYGPF